MEKFIQDRRSFLKGVGLAAAASTTMLAGCAPQTPQEKLSSTAGNDTWDGEYDIIAVGAGFAGLAVAATVASEGNGATCLLLEKEPRANGNSPLCFGGIMCCDDYDDAKTFMRTMLDDSVSDEICDVFAQGICENQGWLKTLGAVEEDLADPMPINEQPDLEGTDTCYVQLFNSKGSGYTHGHIFLTDYVQAHSDVVDFMTETPLESLVQDPSTKAILGVVAGGKHYKANRGVVMCTGGFENDPYMMEQFTGVRGAKPLAAIGNTGDGHRACMAVGADMWHMTSGAQFFMDLRNLDNTVFVSSAFNYAPKQWGITVGEHGRRYYNDFDGCSKFQTNPDVPFGDARLSVGYRHGLTNFGGAWTHLPLPPTSWFIFDQAAYDEGDFLSEHLEDPLGDGWLIQANSIEELAAAIDVPAEELTRTIAVWNSYCDNGHDDSFYRPSDTLTPIRTAPYYAMLCAPTLLNTDGGPVRNEHAQILDTAGNPIPNLYSAGEFGSVWGHYYQGGGNVGECLVFGRIAAREALAAHGEA